MVIVGLTGSIGMGKSTVAGFIRDEGVPVFDSDAAVHALYSGPDARRVEDAFPGVLDGGVVDRARLAERVLGDPEGLRRLEAIVHPLVRAARDAFLAEARGRGAGLAVLDVPLLYETGAEAAMDAVIVVSAPESVQKSRVLARPGMTEAKFSAIVTKQMPDAEKRRRATFVVDTGTSLDDTRTAVGRLIAGMAKRPNATDP